MVDKFAGSKFGQREALAPQVGRRGEAQDAPSNEHARVLRSRYRKLLIKLIRKDTGELSEWSKEHAWKVCIPKGIEGSTESPGGRSRASMRFAAPVHPCAMRFWTPAGGPEGARAGIARAIPTPSDFFSLVEGHRGKALTSKIVTRYRRRKY